MPQSLRWRVFFDDWMRVKMGEMIQDPVLRRRMARLTHALELEPVARALQAPGGGGEEPRQTGGTGGAPISQMTYAAKAREELPHLREHERRA